jgi:hypothetical protein
MIVNLSESNFNRQLTRLHSALTQLQIKLDQGTDLETALYEVECLFDLSRTDIVYMGWVYKKWKALNEK